MVVCNLEREIYFAKFTVQLFEFQNHLLFVFFPGPFGPQPPTQAFQVDVTHGACTLAGGNKRVYITLLDWVTFGIFSFDTPANTTESIITFLSYLGRVFSFLVVISFFLF
jgi:hypothetical protein